MFIGGSPGSTAGGIKTTTAAVLVANAFAVFRRQKSPEMFGRRMEEKAVHDAAAIFTLYLVLSLTGAFVISMVETLPLSECLFETTSAIATRRAVSGVDTASWNRLTGDFNFLDVHWARRRTDYDLCSALRQQKQRGTAAAGTHHRRIKKGTYHEIYFY